MIDTVNDASRPLVMTIVGSKELTITEEHEWSNEEKIAIRKRAIDKVFPKVRTMLVASGERCVLMWKAHIHPLIYSLSTVSRIFE
jgi:hypothetical protein